MGRLKDRSHRVGQHDAIEIVPAGRPTLEEMRRRFAVDEEDEAGGGA